MGKRLTLPFSWIASGFLVALAPGAARAQPLEPPGPSEEPAGTPATSGAPAVLAPPPPPVQAPVPRPPPPVSQAMGRARIGVGYRASNVPDPTFDTFALSGILSQLSVEATYVIVAGDRAALVSGFAWDFGSRQGLFDTFDVALWVHRLTVPIEGRYMLTPWLYGFARVAPGAVFYQARVTDLAAPLEGGPWAPAVDASGGVSLLLFPHGISEGRAARVWLTPEVGYGWAAERQIDLEARRGPVVTAGAPDTLGAVSVRGAFLRVQLGLTF